MKVFANNVKIEKYAQNALNYIIYLEEYANLLELTVLIGILMMEVAYIVTQDFIQ